MINSDKVLEILRSVSPTQISNSEIVSRTGIRPHQQVFQITQRLLKTGRVKGVKDGRDWIFWIEKRSDAASNKKRVPETTPNPIKGPVIAVSSSRSATHVKSPVVTQFKVVIQCAASKVSEVGHFKDRHDKKLLFVTRPDEAPPRKGLRYTHPDELSDDGVLTWRERLVVYNDESENNPLGLLPAYRLYTRAAYTDLVQEFGVDRVFILSAGWGLIRADFLTPAYDISFSNSAKRYSKRGQRDNYADFCHLGRDSLEPIIFLGGKDYQPLFKRLTAHLEAEKVIIYRSKAVSQHCGFTYVKYDTPALTNWHYLCVRDLLAGRLQFPFIQKL